MREKGFYWVRTGDGWVIAEWVGSAKWSGWHFTGREELWPEESVLEVDERRIERKPDLGAFYCDEPIHRHFKD